MRYETTVVDKTQKCAITFELTETRSLTARRSAKLSPKFGERNGRNTVINDNVGVVKITGKDLQEFSHCVHLQQQPLSPSKAADEETLGP
jgi:hypothetical protein